MTTRSLRLSVALLGVTLASPADAQTFVDGRDLAMRTGGFDSGGGWSLTDNGYAGTYIRVARPGPVTLTVNASGQSAGGVAPRLNLAVADSLTGWEVGGQTTPYSTTLDLAAGTYFVRAEHTGDAERSGRRLTIDSLSVSGASVLNQSNDTNALAASDTYIANYRRGSVRVALPGVAPGTEVGVQLKNHAFNWGVAVAGSNFSTIMDPNPSPGTDAFRYQENLRSLFNAVVPENAGKWGSMEFVQGGVWQPQLDKILTFAEENGLRVRGHNVIWGSQQPGWVNDLISQALGGSQSAKTALRAAISDRIDYYVGDGGGDEPTRRYLELDVYNETIHTPEYWQIFGADGVAEIYNEVAQAVAAAGAETRLYTNEFNVLQDDTDFYGNWYRENIEDLLAEGAAVTGIGVQSYENDPTSTWFGGQHDPARKAQTLQNLSVLGLPITLTEFGVKDPTSEADAARILEETARLVFGTPQAEGFFQWGFWRGDIFRGAAALFDQDWNLTQAGERWLELMTGEWDTELTATVGPDGAIQFDGFWGDYELLVGGDAFDLTLGKGELDYTLVTLDGDFNADGIVDSADYAVYRNGLGTTYTQADYEVWRANYGAGYAPAAGASIPEPAAITLLGLVVLATPPRRGRGR